MAQIEELFGTATSNTTSPNYLVLVNPAKLLKTLKDMSTGAMSGGGQLVSPPQNVAPDRLIAARSMPDGSILVRFADQRTGRVDLTQLGISTDSLKPETVRASSWGSAVEVTDNSGHTIHIDSAVLRAHIDPDYATWLQRAISELG